MDQHPIPSQISSYEFKLVGEMTLKQFLKAAAGIILALLINSTKLIFIIKWPLMILFAGTGLALAFVPFQDRPLEKWIVAFLKSIYSPTIYLYRRKSVQNWLDLDLSKKDNEESAEVEPEAPVYQKDKSKLKEFLWSLPSRHYVDERETVVEKKEEELEEIETPKEEIKPEVQPIIKPIIKTEEVVKEEDWRNKKSDLDLKSEKLEATGQAVFGSISMPSGSNIPNVIVGMITDKNGKLLEGAIVEIQDENGNPARVLKTNPLGQFKTSTPLSNGRYLIVIEKEGLIFDRINVILDGKVLPPLKIIPNTN